MIRSLFLFLVISLLVTSSPETTAGQAATPVPQPLAACTVTPRTPDELHALLGDDYEPPAAPPLAVQATPGGEWHIGIEALPDGTPVDSTEVEAVVEQTYSCMAAGDFLRVLALHSNNMILHSRFLSGVGLLMAKPEFTTPTPLDPSTLHPPTRGLFHARLLPDGRIAAVSPIGVSGLPQLYLFVREDDQWRIDDIELVSSGYASSAGDRQTFTGSEFISSGIRDLVIYGWGLEFGPEWTPVVDQETSTDPGLAVLTNGVSLVVAGIPGGRGANLDACVHPEPRDLATSLKHMGLKDIAAAVKRGLVPVTAADGSPLQGAAKDRAFAVYALAAPAGERRAADGDRQMYIECRVMAGGVWTLGVTHIVPAADYEVEAAKRDALLATLEDASTIQAPAN